MAGALNDKDFFHEATIRICGSLEIEGSLFDCYNYIREFIPIDRAHLAYYERGFSAIKLFARADQDGGRRINLHIPLPPELRAYVERKGDPDIFMANDASDNPVLAQISKVLAVPEFSALLMHLNIETTKVGTVIFSARGKNRYEQNHLRLFALLKEPFAIAISNSRRYQEVLDLKELLIDDNRYLKNELRRAAGDEIVGANFGLKGVMEMVRQVAPLTSPVLLFGETGAGKEVIANAIHYSSSRSNGPFVSVNCGAIPDTLIDSELFGHEKGAFTGALSQKRGRFERADNGTIFLDEIGELPLQAQVRLLKVLQSKEIERVGGVKTIPLNIRIIAATHRNLAEMVKLQQFREDLWFRINVFPIWIPPLRERKADIPALLQHFIRLKARELNLPTIPKLSSDAIDPLIEYHWPGNVRELENVIERALILNPTGPLTFDYLNLGQPKKTQELRGERQETDILDELISRHIRGVLRKTEGKIHGSGGAAELLGMNASTLRNRMNKLGIEYGKGKRDQ